MKNAPVNLDLLRVWSQRAKCFLGNANASLIAERHKVILMKINPKLGDMEKKGSNENVKCLLVGEGLVKSVEKYVSTFTALYKAQSNMRRVFESSVFGKAGSSGQLVGRGWPMSLYSFLSRGYSIRF